MEVVAGLVELLAPGVEGSAQERVGVREMDCEVQIAKSKNKQTMSCDCWLISDGRLWMALMFLPDVHHHASSLSAGEDSTADVGVGVVPSRYVYSKTFEVRRLINDESWYRVDMQLCKLASSSTPINTHPSPSWNGHGPTYEGSQCPILWSGQWLYLICAGKLDSLTYTTIFANLWAPPPQCHTLWSSQWP